MTIIKSLIAVSEHPQENLDIDAAIQLLAANQALKKTQASRSARIMCVIECILQVTGIHLTVTQIRTQFLTNVFQKCIGLILSGKILDGTKARNEDYARHLGNLHDKVCSLNEYTPTISLGTIMGKKNSDLREACKALSESLQLNPEKVWLWQGWTVSNDSHSMHLKLLPIYLKYGRYYTERLYEACSQYFSERTTSTIPCLDSLICFLGSEHCIYTQAELLDTRTFSKLVEQLANFHIQYNLGKKESGARPCSQHVLINDWNAHFRTFMVGYLIPHQVIAAPHSGRITTDDIPLIPGDISKQAKRLAANVKKIEGGIICKCKTITPIPMHVTNDKAIEAIFRQMRQDLSISVKWAEHFIQSIEARLDELLRITKFGSASLPKTSRSDLSDASLIRERINTTRIYMTDGFYPSHRHFTKLEPRSSKLLSRELSEWLCIPKQHMLTPFTIYLAAKHEEITNSFLDKCTVPKYTFIADGQIQVEEDFLIGAKPRAKKPEQKVVLNSETAWAVRVLIRLTHPVRTYLKRTQVSPKLHRRLFIMTGKGFGHPTGVRTTDMTGTSRTKFLNAESMVVMLGLTKADAKYLSDNLSVNSARDTSIVLKVIDHMDLSIASTDLDHAFFDLRLLERYVPNLVLLWLMRQEIIQWNTRVLIQALDGHPSTANLAGFATRAELDHYLREALHLPYPKRPTKDIGPTGGIEVIIGIDAGIIAILTSIEQAIELEPTRANPEGIYWAAFSGAIRRWIYSSENPDPYLQEVYAEGLKDRDMALVKDAVYA
ncbi:hypothetical protein HX807_14940 [Pseudomonas sp. D8002]|uniref:hypothetical protein n=1 Tax=unclassified Pseudomonas TaxID=196821 RepID=UPI0015A39293|nr:MULTISPECIES: hypothetical protein [unclassified Pseudomonas]NWA89907.1 hypothetical protein [Pseudomonas sp. D8002]UCP08063.1 hypothetical protein K5R88_19835 [Pseudomonas sp. MM213]